MGAEHESGDPLANIGYISLKDNPHREIEGFVLDPDIRLPVEFAAGRNGWRSEDITWEAILAAILKILAYQPEHEHADYYRRFALAVRPEIHTELSEAAVIKARNRDYDLAIEIFRALEGLLPESPEVKLNLALVYEERAQQEARRDEEQPPGDGRSEADTEAAFHAYKRALEIDPLHPQVHFNFAHFYLRQKNFERAKDHLDAFLAHGAPDDFPEQREKAQKISQEIESWGELDRLFKKSFDAIRMNQEEKGIEYIRQFLTRVPNSWNAWFLLGWGCRRLGRYPEALQAFERSLELKADQPDTLNEMAICLMETGELKKSYLRLQEALRLDPENTKVISNLGVLAMKKDDRQEAAGFFRTVLEIDPEDPLARRYLQMLEGEGDEHDGPEER